MKNQHSLIALAVLVSLGISTLSALAEEKTTPTKEVANYRSTVTSAIDAHMQLIKDIVEGKVPFWNQLADNAVAIVGMSRSLLEIFPDKLSKADLAGAEPASAFKKAAMRFNAEAAWLVQTIPYGNRDAVIAQYKKLSEAYDALKSEIAAQPTTSTEKTTEQEKAKPEKAPEPEKVPEKVAPK
jgi:hypothetical protein